MIPPKRHSVLPGDLLLPVFLLFGLGALMVFGTTYKATHTLDVAYFFKRFFPYVLALFVMWGVSRISVLWLKRHARFLLVLTFLLLLGLLLGLGYTPRGRGATRWYNFGVFLFQPSELAKVVIVVYMADFLSRKQSMREKFMTGFLPPVLVLIAMFGVVLLEPDFGTALLLAILTGVMLYVGGSRPFHLVSLILAALPAVTVLMLSAPYRVKRLLAFLNPWEDPEGIGYQIIHSLAAIHNGGALGQGLGASHQQYYLPDKHTDFILAIFSEEFGFVGMAVVILVLLRLLWVGRKLTRMQEDPFRYLLCFGLVFMLLMQSLMNLAVITASMPNKGIPMPFVSYGGSSLVMSCAAIGLLLAVIREQHATEEKPSIENLGGAAHVS